MEHGLPISKNQVKLAYAIAVIVDLIQLPANVAFIAAWLSGPVGGTVVDVSDEGIDILFDILTGIVTSWLIGFHWVLLPSFLLETVPYLTRHPPGQAVSHMLSRYERSRGGLLI